MPTGKNDCVLPSTHAATRVFPPQTFFVLIITLCKCLVLLQPNRLRDNKQPVCTRKNKLTLSTNLETRHVSFPDTQRPSLVPALEAVGEHHGSFSVMRPELIPLGSVSGLADKFLFFPLLGWPLAKVLGGRVSACMDQTGKESAGI